MGCFHALTATGFFSGPGSPATGSFSGPGKPTRVLFLTLRVRWGGGGGLGGFPVATRTIIRPFPLKLPPPRPRLLSCCYYWYYPHGQNFWMGSPTLRVRWGGFWEYHAATPSSHAWSRMGFRLAGLTQTGRSPGGPRSRYVWSSAKFLVHKQGRQGVQSHVLLGKCGFAGGLL